MGTWPVPASDPREHLLGGRGVAPGKVCQIWKQRAVLDERFPSLLLLNAAWKFDSHFFTRKEKKKASYSEPLHFVSVSQLNTLRLLIWEGKKKNFIIKPLLDKIFLLTLNLAKKKKLLGAMLLPLLRPRMAL